MQHDRPVAGEHALRVAGGAGRVAEAGGVALVDRDPAPRRSGAPCEQLVVVDDDGVVGHRLVAAVVHHDDRADRARTPTRRGHTVGRSDRSTNTTSSAASFTMKRELRAANSRWLTRVQDPSAPRAPRGRARGVAASSSRTSPPGPPGVRRARRATRPAGGRGRPPRARWRCTSPSAVAVTTRLWPNIALGPVASGWRASSGRSCIRPSITLLRRAAGATIRSARSALNSPSCSGESEPSTRYHRTRSMLSDSIARVTRLTSTSPKDPSATPRGDGVAEDLVRLVPQLEDLVVVLGGEPGELELADPRGDVVAGVPGGVPRDDRWSWSAGPRSPSDGRVPDVGQRLLVPGPHDLEEDQLLGLEVHVQRGRAEADADEMSRVVVAW